MVKKTLEKSTIQYIDIYFVMNDNGSDQNNYVPIIY